MAKVQRLQYGVDRIEDGGWVVLEDGDARTFTVPRGWLPANVREGDVISVSPEEKVEGVRCAHFDDGRWCLPAAGPGDHRRADRRPPGPVP